MRKYLFDRGADEWSVFPLSLALPQGGEGTESSAFYSLAPVRGGGWGRGGVLRTECANKSHEVSIGRVDRPLLIALLHALLPRHDQSRRDHGKRHH